MSTENKEIAADTAADILKGVDIPPCPAVVTSLMQEVARSEPDMQSIARLIASDVGLAAATLKTVNSPFFARSRKVQSIPMAISVLGLKNILKIVTGLGLRNSFKTQNLDMEQFWERSNLTAIACEHVAAGQSSITREDAYTFGIFHDCGIPILMQKFPGYKDTVALVEQSGNTQGEDSAHSTNHAIAGYMLARNWGLSPLLSQAIRYHHDPSYLDDPSTGETLAVQTLIAVGTIGEHIVASFLEFPDDGYWELIGSRSLKHLGMSLKEFDMLSTEIVDELAEMQNQR